MTTPNTISIRDAIESLSDQDDRRRARNLIRAEYGDSENFMTPNVLGYVLLAPNVAAEVSYGYGLRRENGERPRIVGISIAKRLEDGSTDRLTMTSGVLIEPEARDVDEALRELRDGFPQDVPTWKA